MIYLFILLLIFGFLTPFYKDGEFALVEIVSAIVLITSLLVHLRCKKYFLKISNNFIFISRAFLLFFLFYEEISFLTTYLIAIPKGINRQAEFNIHNLSFLNQAFLKIPLPFTNYFSSISLLVFAIHIFSFFLGCGLFLPYFKRFRYLFWEKQYAIFSFVFFGNFVLSAYIREIYNSSFIRVIHVEYIELFLYVVFLLDVLQKRKIMKQIYYKKE